MTMVFDWGRTVEYKPSFPHGNGYTAYEISCMMLGRSRILLFAILVWYRIWERLMWATKTHWEVQTQRGSIEMMHLGKFLQRRDARVGQMTQLGAGTEGRDITAQPSTTYHWGKSAGWKGVAQKKNTWYWEWDKKNTFSVWKIIIHKICLGYLLSSCLK